MIIFTANPFDVYNYLDNPNNTSIYNLTSYIELPMLNKLIPTMSNIGLDGLEDSDEYSIRYENMVLEDREAFEELMNIMEPVYNEDKDIIIAIDVNDQYRALINECLSGLIASRYGYPCAYITSPKLDINDLEYITKVRSVAKFSDYGINNMDNDIKRIEMGISFSPDEMKEILNYI